MKKQLFTAIALVSLIAACKNDDSKNASKDSKTTTESKVSLVGKWDVTDVTSKGEDQLPEESRKMLIDEAVLEFTSDSKAIQHFHGESDTANFTFDAENGKLYTVKGEKSDTSGIKFNSAGNEFTLSTENTTITAKKM